MTTVEQLRCEYLLNPLGVDVARPRLSWELRSERKGARQTAYQIEASGEGWTWDSDRTTSDESVGVRWAGPDLRSRQRVVWRVRVWDERGVASPWSQPASFETGLLDVSDWQARWIGAPWLGGPKTSSPCPFFRTVVSIRKPIATARLYASALGVYELEINGRRVGDDVLAPGWTDYRRRVPYRTYDVTALLRRGGNRLGAVLGDGWAAGNLGWRDRQCYADRPRLLAQLEIRYADGERQIITSGPDWEVAMGPILESDLLMGESYDARLLPANWQPALVYPAPAGRLAAHRGPPVRAIREALPVGAPKKVGAGWIFDLGQNIVGRVRLKVRGEAGQTVTIRHAEMLNPDGTLYTANLRRARATDHYTLAGGRTEIWEPRFTFHGFRYVELTGYPGVPPRDAVTGIVLHSDISPTGEFECSDLLLNQLQRNIQWGQRGNFLEVPTDCPQRDERLGWTGDAQVFYRTAAFNFDTAAFFTKWLDDLSDAQADDGTVPAVAPNIMDPDMDGGPAWADAIIICPWNQYLCFGDRGVLEEHYDALQRFLERLRRQSPGWIRVPYGGGWQGFGDWLAKDGSTDSFGLTPKDLIGTAFFAHSAQLLSRIAAVLGRAADAKKYAGWFERIRRAFQRRFVTREGLVGNQTQACYVLALHFDLLPASLRPTALDNLVRDIAARGDRLSTGFVGTSYLPWVLSDNGRLDVAYRLLFQKQWPSWLYAVTQGATTIWERWDGWTHDKGFQDPGMNSFNHYAYGAIGAWLYGVVAGLQPDPDRPGYRHLIIAPRPGGGLTRARARQHTPYGIAESRWTLRGDRFELRVVVPPNATATVRLPDGSKPQTVGAGRHVFIARLKHG